MEQEDPRQPRGGAFVVDQAGLSAVLSEAPECIVVEALDGKLLYANRDAVASMEASSLAEAVDESSWALEAHFELRDEAGRLLSIDDMPSRRALAEDTPENVVAVRSLRDGKEYWRLVKSRALRDEGGRPRAIITTWHDLTQRRRTEAGLRLRAEAGRLLASSLDYETTLKNLAGLVVPVLADVFFIDIVDEAGVIRRVQAASGDPAEEEIVERLRAYPPRWDRPHPNLRTLREGTAQLFPDLPPDVYERVLLSAHDDEHRDLLQRIGYRSGMCVPLVARGQILGAMTLGMTRSGRRYDREDLQLAEDLGRVAGLSMDNARLYLQAQRAVQLRDEFLQVAAHELKTPLTSLHGFAQLSLKQLRSAGPLGETEMHRLLLRFERQSHKLGRLVAQLLDISRLESGRMVLESRREDLVALVERVIAEFCEREGHGRTTLTAPPSLVCLCDPLRIEQVLTNLLDNAAKYSPADGPIAVSLGQRAGCVRLEVEDRGIGIPPEHRERVFDRYYQAHADRHLSGMGLGLYISREIAHLHGGRLFAEFPEPEGTRIVVELPLGCDDGEASA